MEEKINIAELLKDCPKGMGLDCVMSDKVTFDYIDVSETDYPIVINTPIAPIRLTINGCYYKDDYAKCVIFPKGQTTWEGFVSPCKFKDGDIIYTLTNSDFNFISIFKEKTETTIYTYADLDTQFYTENKKGLCEIYRIKTQRLATEEEKEKLFDAIKANGYKWNTETKTLEKLIEPKFKVGDRIVKKNGICVPILITKVGDEFYYSNTDNPVGLFSIKEQDDWELVTNKFDITTLKPFESRVLVRHNNDNKWCGTFFSHIDKDLHSHCFKFVTIAGKSYPKMIPYEGNEHLLGTTDDCDEFYKTWK